MGLLHFRSALLALTLLSALMVLPIQGCGSCTCGPPVALDEAPAAPTEPAASRTTLVLDKNEFDLAVPSGWRLISRKEEVGEVEVLQPPGSEGGEITVARTTLPARQTAVVKKKMEQLVLMRQGRIMDSRARDDRVDLVSEEKEGIRLFSTVRTSSGWFQFRRTCKPEQLDSCRRIFDEVVGSLEVRR